MKKLNIKWMLLVAAFAGMTAFNSCQKEDLSSSDPVSKIDLNKIEQIKSLPLAEQRVAFNLLTPEEKHFIWDSKLELILQNSEGKFNANQLNLVKELKENLKPELYNVKKNADVREVFKHTVLKTWEKKAQDVFEPKMLYTVYFTINSFEKDFEGYESISTNRDENSCFCNKGSMYTCPKWNISVTYPRGAGFEYGNGYCSLSGECTTSSMGCGGLLLFSCNGNKCS